MVGERFWLFGFVLGLLPWLVAGVVLAIFHGPLRTARRMMRMSRLSLVSFAVVVARTACSYSFL